MATLLAHITVKPGSEERFEGIARDLYERTHANETGVLRYEYWRGGDPRTYYTLLSFDDHRAFIQHQTSDHHESASPAAGYITGECLYVDGGHVLHGPISALPPDGYSDRP